MPLLNDSMAGLPGPLWRRRDLLLNALASAGLAGLAGAMTTGCATPPAPLNEETAFALGLEAYVYAYPMIYFARLRHLRMTTPDPVTKQRARFGEWLHRNAVITPEVPGAPQVDTFYSNLWLDLSGEPLVLNVPKMDGRYWSLQCCDFLGVTFGLPTRRNMAEGGQVLIAGPDWRGSAPAGMTVLRAPMAQSFVLLRLFFASQEDRLKAINYQQAFTTAPLSAWLRGQASVPGVERELARPVAVKDDALADFKTLQKIWQEAPPPLADAEVTRRFAQLNLGPGLAGFEQLSPEVSKGLARAEAEGRRLVTSSSLALPGQRTANGWVAPKPRIGYYDDGDRLYRAAVTLAGTVAIPAAENPYFVMQKDGAGIALNGDTRYELHFSKDMIPQADAFWSLHAYNTAYKVIPNALERYSLGDRSNLAFGSDGSLTLYIQPEDPGEGKRSNWLPTRKAEIFWLIVRAYEPRGAMKDLSWAGPELRKLA